MDLINSFITALSILLNALTLTARRYETLSARCWRSRANPVFGNLRKLIDAIFLWQPDHCQKIYNLEKSMGIHK